jgi:hypothetical protein
LPATRSCGRSGRCAATPVNALEAEKARGKEGQIEHRLMYVDMGIMYELGYPLFSQAGSTLMLQLPSEFYDSTRASNEATTTTTSETISARKAA